MFASVGKPFSYYVCACMRWRTEFLLVKFMDAFGTASESPFCDSTMSSAYYRPTSRPAASTALSIETTRFRRQYSLAVGSPLPSTCVVLVRVGSPATDRGRHKSGGACKARLPKFRPYNATPPSTNSNGNLLHSITWPKLRFKSAIDAEAASHHPLAERTPLDYYPNVAIEPVHQL